MAKIANTAFEVYVSNSKRNDTQNITGKFGSFSGQTFTGDICSAGFLCVKNSRTPNEGYENPFSLVEGAFAAVDGLKNGNSWYMTQATGGTVTGAPGDHTGIYAANTYDVNRATAGDLVVNIPGKTLGLAIPANEYGDFTELIVGEQYNFGAGNFSTLPTNLTTTPYATISNGLWVASATAPTDGSVYAVVEDISKRFTEGVYDAGQKITLRIMRSVVATA